MSLKDFFDRYASFVTNNPMKIILFLLLLTTIFVIQAGNVKTVASDNGDMLPNDLPVMQSFETIENKFGSSDSAMIVFELDYFEKSSRRLDLRDPVVFDRMYVLGELAKGVNSVIDVTSPAHILKDANGGVLPNSKSEIMELLNSNPQALTYINEYYSLSYISLSLDPSYDEIDLYHSLSELVSSLPPIDGVIVSPGGSPLEGAAISEGLSKDMSKTSMYSLLAILIIVIVVFRSVKYGLAPLATIIVGLVWTMGFVGLMGMNLSSATSGVLSMIMGIGIDFGIQIISRFRQELEKNNLKNSISNTLNAVFIPMTTTTVAAVIGFQAMTLGQLSMLGEMGQIMSYGVIGCYLVALLLLPPLLVVINSKKNNFYKGDM